MPVDMRMAHYNPVFFGESETAKEGFLRARGKATESLWEEYQAGEHISAVGYFDKSVDLIPSSDLNVRQLIDPETGELSGVDIVKKSNPLDLNFMGYDPQQKCFAYRGEARLFDLFVSYTSELLKGKHVRAVCKIAGVRVAGGGLPANMTFEEFAGHVEVIEYGMWLLDSESDSEDEEQARASPISNELRAQEPCQDEQNMEHMDTCIDQGYTPVNGSEDEVTPRADSTLADTNCIPSTSAAQGLDVRNSGRRYPLRARSMPTGVISAPTPKPPINKSTRSNAGNNCRRSKRNHH